MARDTAGALIKSSLPKSIALGFGVVLVILALVSVISYRSINQLEEAAQADGG